MLPDFVNLKHAHLTYLGLWMQMPLEYESAAESPCPSNGRTKARMSIIWGVRFAGLLGRDPMQVLQNRVLVEIAGAECPKP